MNNAMQIFNNEEFGSVRVTEVDGVLWFVAKDVAQALDYNTSKGATPLFGGVPDMWKGLKPIQTPGGKQNLLCVTEQGLYFFLGRSDKPKALPYQMWIAGDVVPSIRKHGAYVTTEVLNELIASPEFGIRLLTELKAERDARIAAETQLEIAKPKAEYYDDLVDKNLLTNIRDTAKEIHWKERSFIDFLLKRGYMYRDQNKKLQPYAQHVTNGLFEIKESASKTSGWFGTQSFITPKGRSLFRTLHNKSQELVG